MDIVERLREEARNWKVGDVVNEAANEIERLRTDKRDQWEYIWCHIITPSELNDWGAKGWELCYGYDSRNAFKQETQYCFFKRRK